MPAKTIYIPQKDLSLVAKATAHSGSSLSSTIIDALRKYLSTQSIGSDGYAQIQVRIGTQISRVVRFLGIKIIGSYDEDSQIMYIVYATKGGKYALVSSRIPKPHLPISAWPGQLSSWVNHNFDDPSYTYQLRIFASLSQITTALPETIAQALTNRLANANEPIQDLDI